MQDENAKLLERFAHILKELTFHAKETKCTHSVSELLDELDFENDSFVRSCKFCGTALELNDKSGRRILYNENGSIHSCNTDRRKSS